MKNYSKVLLTLFFLDFYMSEIFIDFFPLNETVLLSVVVRLYNLLLNSYESFTILTNF